ncbi:MAG TPA: hypothetical protein VGC07_01255 [Granulicella sp.]
MLISALLAGTAAAQQPAAAPSPEQPVTIPVDLPPSQGGTVLFSTEGGVPAAAQEKAADSVPDLTAEERNAPTFTGYDLDVHLTPRESRLMVRARLSVRNDGAQPLHSLGLQLSSSLHWESLELGGAKPVWGQRIIDTDADHTGKANEAVVTLPAPLAPGATVELTALYTGTITPSAERLERIGAPAEQAASSDWDEISPELTALRGFGNVLWYPVAAEPVFLGDGAKLFQMAGRIRLRQKAATAHLRLTVEYVGDAPDAAYFCGRREQLVATSENRDLPVAESPGVAVAEFEAEPLGFRLPSLFVTDRAPTVTDDTLIAAVTDHYDAVPRYAEAAALVRPLITDWLGAAPQGQLSILDHAGQPFEDDALLVLPMRAAPAATLAPSVAHTLAHVWFRSSQQWLDEGVPQFLSLLWVEQSKGREFALAALGDEVNTLALAEPETTDNATAGQPLVEARDEVYYRNKAAAVLWMLRSLAGEDALRLTLSSFGRNDRVGRDPQAFEQALEQAAHKDLRWFFDDWVYRDRGLPDLSIVNVTPRQLPAQNGRTGGWLVSVTVRNDGDAVAEVPVTVRSGELSATERLRIPGRGTTSTRITFQTTPEEAVVNDGSVPEMRTSTHTIAIRPVAEKP